MVGEIEKSKQGNQSSKSLFGKLVGGSGNQENWRSNLQKQEKLLVMIESWGKAFANSRSFPNFRQVYQELRIKGMRFPQPLKDELAPVFTPAAQAADSGDVNVTDPVLKAHRDNVVLFSDMLNASDAKEDLRTNVLVQEMIAILKASQTDVLTKIANNPGEGTMAQLLIVNDDIVRGLQFYEDLLAGKAKRQEVKAPEPEQKKDDKPVASIKEEEEEEEEEPEEAPAEDDILGLGVPVAKPAEKQKKTKKNSSAADPPRRKSSGKKLEGASSASPAASVPKLSPPPKAVNKPLRRSSGGSESAPSPAAAAVESKTKSSSGGDEIFDMLGFGSATPANAVVTAPPSSGGKSSGGTTKKKAGDSSKGTKKTTEKKKQPKSDVDEDDFLAIALREEKPKEPKSSNPFDEIFGS
eukprot:TRINITY_DN9712_c0_g2_i2.p1 TRINITY_DN9712_c0_g2~~TRINITY_DN9712_c0_g2_i2.p1  ORF type:complete len:410 (-),score=155.61 TRINITY_DN9712_c0_g2_i2:1021-2250(-)